MEAIIRTNDNNLFDSLVPFLKSLHITVETKEEKKEKPVSKTKNNFNEAVKFWNSFSIDMSHFKLNREDAYER